MQRQGQSLGRAGALTPPHLSHPWAPDVSAAGRSGIMPIKGETPDLRWLTQHESLPVNSTP
jgi:hypothetical protein